MLLIACFVFLYCVSYGVLLPLAAEIHLPKIGSLIHLLAKQKKKTKENSVKLYTSGFPYFLFI